MTTESRLVCISLAVARVSKSVAMSLLALVDLVKDEEANGGRG